MAVDEVAEDGHGQVERQLGGDGNGVDLVLVVVQAREEEVAVEGVDGEGAYEEASDRAAWSVGIPTGTPQHDRIGGGGVYTPAEYGACVAQVSAELRLHLAPVLADDAFHDVAEQAFVVAEQARGCGSSAGCIVGGCCLAAGVKVQGVDLDVTAMGGRRRHAHAGQDSCLEVHGGTRLESRRYGYR